MAELMLKANCVCGKFLTVFMMGILESAVYLPSLMMVTENFAFMAGSSKHGKAARANVGSNNVAAKYLEKRITWVSETVFNLSDICALR